MTHTHFLVSTFEFASRKGGIFVLAVIDETIIYNNNNNNNNNNNVGHIHLQNFHYIAKIIKTNSGIL